MYVIKEEQVKNIISYELIFDAVKSSFISLAKGDANIFPVVIAEGIHEEEIFSIKSGNINYPKIVGVKLGSYWKNNDRDFGIPNHSTTTLLLNPDNGKPLALIDAGYLNGLRTASANAVASSVLARKGSKVLTVLGAGHQSYFEILALSRLFDFEEIYLCNRDQTKAKKLINHLNNDGVNITFSDINSALPKADIVVTVTSSTEPLFFDPNMINPGTHISAMGADQQGKQELPVSLLSKANLFADIPEQSVRIGEFQHIEKKQVSSIIQIGDVLLNKSKGRDDDSQITIFDSSGVAIQDLYSAYLTLEKAIEKNQVQYIDF